MQSLFVSIHLDFGRSGDITDQSIEYFSNNLSQLKALSALCLDFGYCSRITDEGVESLFRSVTSLEMLTNLCIRVPSDYFSNQKRVTNKSIKTACLSLKSLSNLATVDLDFSGCNNIGERSIKNIISQLKKTKSLSFARFNQVIVKTTSK